MCHTVFWWIIRKDNLGFWFICVEAFCFKYKQHWFENLRKSIQRRSIVSDIFALRVHMCLIFYHNSQSRRNRGSWKYCLIHFPIAGGPHYLCNICFTGVERYLVCIWLINWTLAAIHATDLPHPSDYSQTRSTALFESFDGIVVLTISSMR